ARTAGTTTHDMRAIDKHDANAAERQTTPVTVALPPEQCANCLGPHAADQAACPARPKRDHGLLVSPQNKEQ
ncbi:hypothetical protein H634G_11643, partial [Metarhizium anisopliae BRIP 53293]